MTNLHIYYIIGMWFGKQYGSRFENNRRKFGNVHTTEASEKHKKYRFICEFCEEIAKFKLKTWLELDLDISLFGQQSAK